MMGAGLPGTSQRRVSAALLLLIAAALASPAAQQAAPPAAQPARAGKRTGAVGLWAGAECWHGGGRTAGPGGRRYAGRGAQLNPANTGGAEALKTFRAAAGRNEEQDRGPALIGSQPAPAGGIMCGRG